MAALQIMHVFDGREENSKRKVCRKSHISAGKSRRWVSFVRARQVCQLNSIHKTRNSSFIKQPLSNDLINLLAAREVILR